MFKHSCPKFDLSTLCPVLGIFLQQILIRQLKTQNWLRNYWFQNTFHTLYVLIFTQTSSLVSGPLCRS